jgi:hypothetical protein
MLFTAGHGFYQFAVPRITFDRSLYYNLLLQPALAIPDHYFLQGSWMGDHLDSHRGRDSWVESGLRDGFVVPYFRRESTKLSDLLSLMENSDRRGFGQQAAAIADRLDRTPFKPTHWSSASNSAAFGEAFAHYVTADSPPMLEMHLDPDDFLGFWLRSREWIDEEVERAFERSSALLGSDGILLSQLIQVSGERLLGSDCGRIGSVDELLGRVKTEVNDKGVERDLRAYYVCACEIYNRSLSDTLLTAPNSPRWTRYTAAMDLWRDDLLAAGGEPDAGEELSRYQMNDAIRLPRPEHLRRVSGDVLGTIRRSKACERYFESLAHWRETPHDQVLQDELVEALGGYSREIRKQVGKEVGVLGLKPQFISKSSDVSRLLDKVPGFVQAFLAISGLGVASVGTGMSPYATTGLFSLFCLGAYAKDHLPSRRVGLDLSTRHGARLHADVTMSRA